MANNRLYLKCKRTGEKVCIAKYYPTTGWYVRDSELVQTLNKMFDCDEPTGIWDGQSYELEYDIDKEN